MVCIGALRSTLTSPQTSDNAFCNRSLVRRLLPYAASIWTIDLLVNLFDVGDRYMILHWSTGGTEAGQLNVGEYFGSRVVPDLLLSMGVLVSSTLMPYLAADWESGCHRRVSLKLKRAIGLLAFCFTCIGAAVCMIAPWLYDTVLGGRFETAIHILPMSFALCAWFSLNIVAQDYFWCAERGHFAGYALAVGLVFNLSFNAILIPQFGLQGAVIATAAAMVLTLITLLLLMHSQGYLLSRCEIAAIALPSTLAIGPGVAIISSAIFMGTDVTMRRLVVKLYRMLSELLRKHTPWTSRRRVATQSLGSLAK